MNRNFHNSRGSSTHDRNQNPRWRTILIALVLALAIGSAGQTPPAQAAPASADKIPIDFVLSVSPKPLKVQVCDKLKLYAGVSKTAYKKLGDKVWPLPRDAPNPKVTGERVSGTGTLEQQLQDIDGPPGQSIPFEFTPDKLGKVTLKFTVFIPNKWIGANEEVLKSSIKREIEVKFSVIPCKLGVKTVIHFPVAIYDITVISDDAVMTADESGTFTGSTSMYWVYSNYNLDPCSGQLSATDSQVELTGQLDDDGGQFTATATFQPTTVSGTITCPYAGSRSHSEQGALFPVTFSVASSGGVSIQTATGEGISGLAHIVVTPEEDEAVSFIPGNHEASWDDFSSLFGALLALR